MDWSVHGNKGMNSISVMEDVTIGHDNQEPQDRAHQTINQKNIADQICRERFLQPNAYAVTFAYYKQPGFYKNMKNLGLKPFFTTHEFCGLGEIP